MFASAPFHTRLSRRAAERAVGISHGSTLPAELVESVPQSEKLVLNFVLAYLEDRALPAQLLVNGGYVRDLLLGKPPDDLDLSLCLRECDETVTIDSILNSLSAFAQERPELAVLGVDVTTILSDTSKDKNVDTAKAHLLVQAGDGTAEPERIEVDFMPTIGEETYDERDRVPIRDVRGTPEQDALRRDLTIGAMFLEISRADADGATSSDAAKAAGALRWRLLDFYGGLPDLDAGVLRSPYPLGRSVSEVWSEVLRTPQDERNAIRLGLSKEAVAAPDAARTLQIVWWIKVLRDDPLRLLRALRFAAKLRFALHETFWDAVPFAILPLQTKVAGSRKCTELGKISKAGVTPLLNFLEMAFGRQVRNVTLASEEAEEAAYAEGARVEPSPPRLSRGAASRASPSSHRRSSAALTQGQRSLLGRPSRLRRVAASLVARCTAGGHRRKRLGFGDDESFGCALASAAAACRLPWGMGISGELEMADASDPADVTDGQGDGSSLGGGGGAAGGGGGAHPAGLSETDAALDAAAAAAASAAMAQVSLACDGLCASNDLRAGAETPLYCASQLLQPSRATGMQALFAEAAGLCDADGENADGGGGAGHGGGTMSREGAAAEIEGLVSMWNVLKLERVLQGKAPAGYRPRFAVAIAAQRSSTPTAQRFSSRLQKLLVPGVVINGKALVGMGPRLPNHLRGVLLSHLHVLARLRGESTLELNEGSDLQHYLDVTCNGLLQKLFDEWYDEAGALRPQYAVPGKAPKVPKAKGEKPPPKGDGGKQGGGVSTRSKKDKSEARKGSPGPESS